METTRRLRDLSTLGMQENIFVNKGKTAGKAEPQIATTKRAVLGNLNTNVRLQPLITGKGKPLVSNEVEKSNITTIRPVTRSYKNVNAKVDTRLTTKTSSGVLKVNDENNPKLLRRDDSVSLAAKAGAITARLKQTKISNLPTSRTSSKENLLPKENEKNVQKVEPKKLSNPTLKCETFDKDSKAISKRFTKQEAYSTELLDGVEDIDSGDGKSPLLMGIYIKDIYNYLMELELQYPIRENHLDKQTFVTPKMRATLIDWLVEVHNQFHLTLETLHLTVAIIDRYLQDVRTIKKSQIQLVGITALFIASKYEELYIPDIQDFVFITDYTYTKLEILHCEKEILSRLMFSLGRPLPVHFERRFIKAAGAKVKVHYLAKYLIDLCLIEYDMAHYRPSEIAASAVCLSISTMSLTERPEKCWTPTLQYYSGYKFESLKPIIRKMAAIVTVADTARYKAVLNKYNSSKLGQVSSFPELKGELIMKIAKEVNDS